MMVETVTLALPDDLVKQANVIKEVLLQALVKDEILEKQQADAICERYAIVLEKPGFFGKMFRKIEGGDPKEYYYRVVKVVS